MPRADNKSGLDTVLQAELDLLKAQGLRRVLRRLDSPQGIHVQLDGKSLINFSSNDYLGLANHPQLKEAARLAIEKFGVGAGASRLISGSLGPHHELEAALAEFKNTEAALSFNSGYAVATGVLPALLGKGDYLILDKLVHACIVDGARLSGARLRVFAHNDLAGLEERLAWARRQAEQAGADASGRLPRILVVTESVFSMDGDWAPLAEIVVLKERYGAWLMVDEAHGTGLYGPKGRGLLAELNLDGRAEIQMGTLGKAFGASGGFICGSRALIEYLLNRARSFIFSTAPPPAVAAAALAGVKLAQSSEGDQRRRMLWERVEQLRNGLAGQNWRLPPEKSAILPLIVGEEERAVRLSRQLQEAGFFIPAIRHPTVARGQARLRLTVSASHTSGEVAGLLEAMRGQSGAH